MGLKWDVRLWTGFSLLGTDLWSRGGLLCILQWTFWFCKNWALAWSCQLLNNNRPLWSQLIPTCLPPRVNLLWNGSLWCACFGAANNGKYLLRVGTTCWVGKNTLSVCLSVCHFILYIIQDIWIYSWISSQNLSRCLVYPRLQSLEALFLHDGCRCPRCYAD